MTDYMKEAERLLNDVVRAATMTDCHGVQADVIYRESRAALLAHIQRGAPEGDDGKRVLREVFALCEDTEAKCYEDPSDFNRGRSFEAKGIARAIGAWYQEEFCGRTHMGGPAAPAPDHFRNAAEMVAVHCTPTEHEGRIVYEHTDEPISNADGFVLYAVAPAPAEVPMPEPIGFIDSNDEETWATLTQNAHELATLKLRSTVFHVSQMHTYGAACRAAGEAAGYARGIDACVAALVALKPQSGVNGDGSNWLVRISRQDCVEACAALRGEVKP